MGMGRKRAPSAVTAAAMAPHLPHMAEALQLPAVAHAASACCIHCCSPRSDAPRPAPGLDVQAAGQAVLRQSRSASTPPGPALVPPLAPLALLLAVTVERWALRRGTAPAHLD